MAMESLNRRFFPGKVLLPISIHLSMTTINAKLQIGLAMQGSTISNGIYPLMALLLISN